MIGNTRVAYIWVVSWATILNSVATISVFYCILAFYLPYLPRWPLYWTIAETLFYLLLLFYRKYHIQRLADHPLLETSAQRIALFDQCLNTTDDTEQYLSKWFLDAPLSDIRKENIEEFLRWAFLNEDSPNPQYDDEVRLYVEKIEQKLGVKFEEGRSDVKCLRLTLDIVDALHRSLIWYACIFVVDTLTHLYLRFYNFHFYRASVTQTLKILPPRPQAFILSSRSPSDQLSYWYRPHTSTTALPVLFIHGIGVGLYPYMEFLKELSQTHQDGSDGGAGILAVEILPISSRLTSPVLVRAEMCRQIRKVLDHHSIDQFVLVSHSYGSVIATHLLKDKNIARRISSTVFVDPISILLNQPDVAFNFVSSPEEALTEDTDSRLKTVRKPRLASEWLLWYFGSKDIGVAHTLGRTFFWSENVLWKEDIIDHRCVVFLSEKDSIINASKVWAYLTNTKTAKGIDCTRAMPSEHDRKHSNSNEYVCQAGLLKVILCPGLDHGQVFDIRAWRERLRGEVTGKAHRVKR